MTHLFQAVRNLDSGAEILRHRAYGMIEVAAGQLVQIKLKPWPKLVSIVEARWIRGWKQGWNRRDVCRLYYNQPRLHRNYLTLNYIESSHDTRWQSIVKALAIFDEIAYLKQSDAILAELSNAAISDRLMQRLGWARHREDSPQRHWIKRFYGEYPATIRRRQPSNSIHRRSHNSGGSPPI